jgi:asparagine synthase (glutamine-hydrolysing)
MYLWSRSILANYILAVERVDAAHAIEVRIPYLDHELVEYARQIPACLLVQNGREKYLLREALQPLVTEAVYRRRKHAFIAPPTTIRAGDALYGAIRNILEDPGCLDPEIFNSAAVAGLLDRLPGMSEHVRIRYEPILFMVASTCILKRRYGL